MFSSHLFSKVSASQCIETELGSEYVERFRKEVLEEEPLSPEEKAEREATQKRREKADKEWKRVRLEHIDSEEKEAFLYTDAKC